MEPVRAEPPCVVTQAGGLHPRRRVHRVPKQAVTRHLRPHDPGHHWPCRHGNVNAAPAPRASAKSAALPECIPARICSWVLGLWGILKVRHTPTRSRAILAISEAWRMPFSRGTPDTTMSARGAAGRSVCEERRRESSRRVTHRRRRWSPPCRRRSCR